MNQRGLRWSCLLLVGVVAIGCGGDDGDGATGGVGGGGFGGVAGSAGAGTGGAGGTGGSAGTMVTVMPVPCGTTMCQPPTSPFGMFAAILPPGTLPQAFPCCLNQATNMCGLAPMMGAMCEPMAMRHMNCAGISLMIPGMMGGGAPGGLGFGCCTAMNQCGVDGSAFGRGCVANSEATTMLGPLAGFLMVPAPKTCDTPLPMAGTGGAGAGGAGGDEDAGTP